VIVRRVSVVALVVAALVIGAVGSASAATVSPEDWAPKFCSTIDSYQKTISTESEDLTSTLSGVTNLKQGRAEIVAFLGKMVTAAKTAKNHMKAAGVPSSTNGSKIAAKFVSALDQSTKVFSEAKAQASKVSVKTPAAFEKQGTKVGTDLQKAADQLGKGFDGVSELDTKGELQTAAQASPECAFLSSGSSTTESGS
jgi:hypothetical protein